jgi:pimeloyl-ACP methyl ester carboxylesterase
MRQALPESRVRLAELEGGGHWFYQDFPGAFEAVVRWYLNDFATSEPEGR